MCNASHTQRDKWKIALPMEVWNYLLCQNTNRYNDSPISPWSHASYVKSLVSRQGEKQCLRPRHKPRDAPDKPNSAAGDTLAPCCRAGRHCRHFQAAGVTINSSTHTQPGLSCQPHLVEAVLLQLHQCKYRTILPNVAYLVSLTLFIFYINITWVGREDLAVGASCAK